MQSNFSIRNYLQACLMDDSSFVRVFLLFLCYSFVVYDCFRDIFSMMSAKSIFFKATHLQKRLCPSVRPSVPPILSCKIRKIVEIVTFTHSLQKRHPWRWNCLRLRLSKRRWKSQAIHLMTRRLRMVRKNPLIGPFKWPPPTTH